MKPAHPLLRIWGIRHIRAAYHHLRVLRHYDFWYQLGYLPHNLHQDMLIVDKIRKGEL